MQETFERKLKKMKVKNKELFKQAIEEHLRGGTSAAQDHDHENFATLESKAIPHVLRDVSRGQVEKSKEH